MGADLPPGMMMIRRSPFVKPSLPHGQAETACYARIVRMQRVSVEPKMLRWALDRSEKSVDSLRHRFSKIEAWLDGDLRPTLKQLEGFAKATHTPIGFLFLPEPPVEELPIPDFRTVRNQRIGHPSPDLLDTLYLCQQRQAWYRSYARSTGETPLPFVGSATPESDVESTAAAMRDALEIEIAERRSVPSWAEALRRLIAQAEALGVLVMVSGVVGNNNHRKLDPDEFRGFALADDLAPLVFVNGADTKSAQMFTLAHELAHIWLGRSAVSDTRAVVVPEQDVESWCNRVAAELLVPLDVIRAEYRPDAELGEEMRRLARYFKVSTLVILRRIHDAGRLTRRELWQAYELELERLRELDEGGGGNFYLTEGARVSKRFARALVISTLEGQTLHRDAFQMLGFSKVATFRKLGESLGVV